MNAFVFQCKDAKTPSRNGVFLCGSMSQIRSFLTKLLHPEGHEEHEEDHADGLIQTFASFASFVVNIGLRLGCAVPLRLRIFALNNKNASHTHN
jgi:hypothetical protein